MAGKHALPHWYLIQCKPRQDARAEENLARQSYTCFRPICTVTRRRANGEQQCLESLFPGYLFIQLDRVTDNWHPIRSTRGVSQLVRFGDQPAIVPDELVDEIRQRLAAPPEPTSDLAPGDRVRLTGCNFKDLEAIFLAQDGNKRALILLQLLQREHTISVPLRSIDKL
ncbi:transcription/translation regulatory transformer protein RfaH [Pseudomonas sp. CR3202]|uniref:transcription/translation regulatory transformer protein RfaH n=1 Tax=Pseudomonas sp. CR3202 TaxID=3351532 RepID=UPI003BF3FFB2